MVAALAMAKCCDSRYWMYERTWAAAPSGLRGLMTSAIPEASLARDEGVGEEDVDAGALGTAVAV